MGATRRSWEVRQDPVLFCSPGLVWSGGPDGVMRFYWGCGTWEGAQQTRVDLVVPMAGPGGSTWPDPVGPHGRTWVTRAGRDVRGLYPGELGRVHVLHPEDLGRGHLLHPGELGRDHLLHSSGSHQAPTSACRRSGREEAKAKEEVYQRSFDLQVLRSLEVQRHLQAPPRPPETSYLHHYGRWSPLVPLRSRVSCSPPSHY
ncbi:unnamed protein product [Merluccius merluccius]